MTESIYPRWVVTYRAPSPGSQPQTLTIAAPDMVAAIKAAQMKLAALRVADDASLRSALACAAIAAS